MLSTEQVKFALSCEEQSACIDELNEIIYIVCHTRRGVYCIAFDHSTLTLLPSQSFLAPYTLLAQMNMTDWPFPSTGGQRSIMMSKGDKLIVRLTDNSVKLTRGEDGRYGWVTSSSKMINERSPIAGEEWTFRDERVTIACASQHSVTYYHSDGSGNHLEVSMYAFMKYSVPTKVNGGVK